MLCSYCRISGRHYYLNYTPSSEVEEYFKKRMDFFDTIADNASRVYGGCMLSFIIEGDTLPAYYLPPIFEEYEDAAELGISPDTGKAFTEITVDGEKYMYAVTDAIPMEGLHQELYGALIVPYDEYYAMTLKRSAILLIAAAAFMVVLAVWVLAVIKLIRREVITASQRRRYAAGRMRLVALSVGVIGLVSIMLFSMFTDALSTLYYDTQTCDAALETLKSIEAENRAYDASLASDRETLYLDYAHRIAEILTEYPDVRAPELLWEFNDIIGSDYLMLFDYNGREISSSTQFLTLSYGDTPESSTYDFRRLITGVTGIVHEPCVDEITGLNRQLIGVPLGDGNGGKGYDSLIVALMPEDTAGQLPVEEVMRTITPSGDVLLAIDKETGNILHASDAEFSGKNAFELGMAADSLRDDFMDFFSFNGERWYGCINEYDGMIYLCAEKTDRMFGGIVRDGLARGAMFFLAYLILAAALLWGVTERAIDEYGGRVVEDHESLPRRPDDSDRLTDRLRRWWHRKTPEKKAWFTLKLLLGVSLAMLVLRIRGSDDSVGEFAIIAYVLNGRWSRGVNLFALTQIAIILVTVLLVLLGIDVLIGVVSGMVDNKGETVCQLVGSLVKYAVVLLALVGAFEALGFDTRTLLASVGVFSLAISLGAKDLVADVLSGISIVFSGEYQIDDIVEIGGFRGKVWEIALS